MVEHYFKFLKQPFMFLFVWGFTSHSRIFHSYGDVTTFYVSLFVCLWFFVPLERIFHSYGDVTITGEGLQILTYARHFWLFSSVVSLVCHTYCNKLGHPFTMVISKDPWHSYLLLSIWQWSCHYLFLLGSVAAGIRTPKHPLVRRTL